MLSRFRRKDPHAEAAAALHDALSRRAREEVFYTHLGVPDSIDGRFDLIALHAFLLMQGLKGQGRAGAAIGTRLATAVFAGFEQGLRDLGVSDFGMPRRIKALANAFYGRLNAYGSAAGDEEALSLAVVRNLFRGDATRKPEAAQLARYMIVAGRHLVEEGRGPTLLEGRADFGPLP
jgi:cytochrome b pre-mRNA-processing protein 3